MFVDASAIVAILTRESDADGLADRLEAGAEPITSPIAIFEAVLGICRKRQVGVEEVQEEVRAFLGMAGIGVVAISDGDAGLALKAFDRYGKGRGHPAQLNLGDCFAYACAKARHVPVLCKGDDFRQTDIETA
ncbi:type II toxin-antitoxin system VapC family toxin [Inquilinus limosus]|uniref:Ribonuclease VapC n=1 Tax=Inquilinus limosus TaxID=171674 RepID=A0A211ZTN8_9PROT|nr:type II toxin-antitoxin system VapC family toxin [Inquilinus limosus]OWJ68641.1 VapC toxin family PIN domain ribonuclease [Inquilinus limosus]